MSETYQDATPSNVARLHAMLGNASGNVALGVVSLENLGRISSQHGMAAGARAAEEFNARLSELLRTSDRHLVLSNDHLCFVLDELIDENHLLLAGLKIERTFDRPLTVDEAQIRLDARAGLVFCGELTPSMSSEDLYQHAEAAREAALARDVVFHIAGEESLASALERWELDTAVAAALDRHDFTLDYEPEYRLNDGELVGIEALLRWRRGGAVVPTDEYLPKLSRGRLWELTVYCVRRAVREMSHYPNSLPVAVNVAVTSITHPGLVTFIKDELAIWDIAPSRLTLEIPETDVADDNRELFRVLRELRAMGIGVAVDHFGTGQLSMEHFRNLPATEIKIDRRFVSDIVSNEANHNVAQTIIDMAHRFGKLVVADGIEDGATASHLIGIDCDVGQGFYLGAPLSHQQFLELLRTANYNLH
jgi:EAL domain-containing protein (putative c-di-GMP-specific phosphodiesterase class I)/GGDEF domain-containing protein